MLSYICIHLYIVLIKQTFESWLGTKLDMMVSKFILNLDLAQIFTA